jgi:hypothetical protein
MQSLNSRMNQTNEFANLSKRCVGVLALPVIPGCPLPLMATSAVFSTPSVSQPEIGLNQSQVQRTGFWTGLVQELPAGTRNALVLKALAWLSSPMGLAGLLMACDTGCGLIRHRERIEAMTRRVAERFRPFGKRLRLDLEDGNGGGVDPAGDDAITGCRKS